MQLMGSLSPRPRILFIDAYDSYTNNIVALLQVELEADVQILKIDAFENNEEHQLQNLVDQFDAVVCGPGPGNVAVEKDIGVMGHIWHLPDEHLLPVLGICLGFQSLAAAYGAKVKQLNQPQHGMIRDVTHVGLEGSSTTIFDGISNFGGVLYQSWFVSAEDITLDKVCELPSAPELRPLAWIEKDDQNPRILVAIEHTRKPFTGLQYHPESICTDVSSRRVIRNWFEGAIAWNLCRSRDVKVDLEAIGTSPAAASPRTPPLLSLTDTKRSPRCSSKRSYITPPADGDSGLGSMGFECQYKHEVLDLPPGVIIPDLVEAIQDMRRDHIILESSNSHLVNRSSDTSNRYSIIALDVDESLRIDYRVGDNFATCGFPMLADSFVDPFEIVDLASFGGNIWSLLAIFMENRAIKTGIDNLPFWGGLMGYTTYELGLENLGVLNLDPLQRSHTRPDMSFAYITRSLVVDHWTQQLYVQQLVPLELQDEDLWLATTTAALKVSLQNHITSIKACPSIPNVVCVVTPEDSEYETSVENCQELIRQGDSYELCLTGQTHVTLPVSEEPGFDNAWLLYKKLRKSQPAPFASSIRLGRATLVSSSPERFLTWDADGKCEMRPMKGTVKKSDAVSTLQQAEKLLRVPKEIAENLMIVDLTRHDMQKVCPAGNVQVPKAMVVQEYASVFQMISIVEGRIKNDKVPPSAVDPAGLPRDKLPKHTGLDMLAASLPPGSMTGAPKFRSCQLLRSLEHEKERSLYSGVVGYIDVGGRADFSVTIRSMFRWDDEVDHEGGENDRKQEVWHIGAGGAVTTLSNPVEERKEMQAKLAGTLGIICSGSA